MGPIGVVLSARYKNSTPGGTSTKHTHSLKHRYIHALHKALPNTTGKHPTNFLESRVLPRTGGNCFCWCMHGQPASSSDTFHCSSVRQSGGNFSCVGVMQEMWKNDTAGFTRAWRPGEEDASQGTSRRTSGDGSISRCSRHTASTSQHGRMNTHNILFDSSEFTGSMAPSRQSSIPLLPVATSSHPSTTVSTREQSNPVRDGSQSSQGRGSWGGHKQQQQQQQQALTTRSHSLATRSTHFDPVDSGQIGLAMPPGALSSSPPSATLNPSRSPSSVATRCATPRPHPHEVQPAVCAENSLHA